DGQRRTADKDPRQNGRSRTEPRSHSTGRRTGDLDRGPSLSLPPTTALVSPGVACPSPSAHLLREQGKSTQATSGYQLMITESPGGISPRAARSRWVLIALTSDF